MKHFDRLVDLLIQNRTQGYPLTVSDCLEAVRERNIYEAKLSKGRIAA